MTLKEYFITGNKVYTLTKTYAATKKWQDKLESEWPTTDKDPATYPDEDFAAKRKQKQHMRIRGGKPYQAGTGQKVAMKPVRAQGIQDARKQMEERIKEAVRRGDTAEAIKISAQLPKKFGLGETIRSKKSGNQYRIIEVIGENILAKEGSSGRLVSFKEDEVEKV
jgi:hypothetical protein